MASVSELIVREYFEMHGYLISQPRKYALSGRRKRLDEEIDLLVFNPQASELKLPESMIWTGADLKNVPQAIVSVYGWHTERFYPATLEQIPDLLRFAGKEVAQLAARRMGNGVLAKILCFPQLPASARLRNNAMDLLKQQGIDGVLLFRTMLLELINGVDTNKNYEKSDLLQTLRIMKNYDLVQSPQQELFVRRRGKTKI